MINYAWTCSCCGEQHDTLPFDWRMAAPDDYNAVPEAEREARTLISRNFCTVDGQAFVRGVIEIPVTNFDGTLRFSVWLSVSDASERTILQVWDEPECGRHGPFFGWLRSRLAPYPDTLNLKASLRLRDDIAPAIDLEPTDHPLAVEQRRGISVARVAEIAGKLMSHR